MKKLFSNRRLLIAVMAIIIVVVFAIFEWSRAIYAEIEVVALCEVSNEPCPSRLPLYELPFKHIILFSGIIFSSAFLLLNALKNKE